MAIKNTLCCSVVAAVVLTAAQTPAMADDALVEANSIDPKAQTLLKKMSDYVGGLKSYSADVGVIDQNLLGDGFKLSLYRQGKLEFRRPNKFRMSRQGMLRDQEVIYNGKDLVFFGKTLNVFVTVPAPGDVDTGLDAVVNSVGAELPARDLLSLDAYTPLMDAVTKAVYIGKVQMGDQVCHQMAFRTDDVDWQLWVQDGEQPLPCLYSITSKWLTGSPEFTVRFRNWVVDADIPDATFEFQPPKGARSMTLEQYNQAVANIGE